MAIHVSDNIMLLKNKVRLQVLGFSVLWMESDQEDMSQSEQMHTPDHTHVYFWPSAICFTWFALTDLYWSHFHMQSLPPPRLFHEINSSE